MSDKLYYYVSDSSYQSPSTFEVVTTSKIARNTYPTIKEAVEAFEKYLVDYLDDTIERLIEDRQKLINFRNCKSELIK